MTDITEDSRGAIWVSTWGGGIWRLHGSEWKVFGSETGHLTDWAKKVAVDERDRVWVATWDGLFLIEEDEVSRFHLGNTPKLRDEELEEVIVHRSEIWIGTRGGYVQKYNPDSGDWDTPVEPEFPATIDRLFVSPRGKVWAVQRKNEGLREVESGEDPKLLERLSEIDYLLAREPAQSSAVYCVPAFGQAITRVEGNLLTELPGPGVSVTDACVSDWGALVTGSPTGVFTLKGTEWEQVDLGKELGTQFVTSTYFSRDGRLWIGTRSGLVFGDPPIWENYPTSDLGSLLYLFLPYHEGAPAPIAISESGHLAHLVEDYWESMTKLEGYRGRLLRVSSVSTERFLGISEGVALQWRTDTGELLRESQRLSENIDQILETRNGRIWGMTEKGIFEWVGDEWIRLEDYQPKLDPQIHSILESTTGEFWVGYNNGIERWREGEVEVFGEEDGIDTGDTVASIYRTRTGDLWFGTRGSGIYVYDGSEFRQTGKEQGLLQDSVQEIFEASDGAMWVSYRYSGVAMWRGGQWVNFTELHGLPNSQVTAFVEDHRGDVWLSTAAAGLYRYRKDLDPPNTFLDVAPSEIDYRGAALFSFNGWDHWDHTPVSRLRYSWRVVADADEPNPEEGWTQPDTKTLAITPRLPPGSYRLEVRTLDDDGNIDPTPATSTFQVLPPFWATPAFLIPMVSLLVLATIFGFGHFRGVHRLEVSRLKLEDVNRSLREENQNRTVVEDALRKAEEKSRILIQKDPRGIVILDAATGKFTEVNKGATELYGFSAEELVQYGPIELSPPTQPDGLPSAEAAKEYIEKALQGENQFFEWVHLNSKGEEMVCEVHLARLSEVGANSIRASLNNITQRKENEAELERYRKDLESLVAERTHDLEEAQEKLLKREKLATLGRLVATVSHELRNPLGSISGSVFTLSDRLKESDIDVERPIQRIERNIARCTRIIEDLLDFTRTKNPTLVLTQVDPWLKEMIEDYDFPADVEVKIDLETPAEVMVDKNRFFRCVVNLMNNACDAMVNTLGEEGDRQKKLCLRSCVKQDRYLFQVRDSGPGIPEEEMEKVFEPLYSTKSFGVGLGVPIIQQIMDQHGGGLEFDSVIGEGVTATLWFPLIRQGKDS